MKRAPASTVSDAHASAYRGRQIAGLLILGTALLAAALARARWHDVFPHDWWHVW